MAFEFFFGLFGLISSDSKSRHKSRLESEWRLPTPLNVNLFRDSAGLKSPLTSASSPTSSSSGFGGKSAGSGGGGKGALAGDQKQRPIFSTTGTLAAANSSSVSEGLFSSASSSSASSIASSGSNLTTNSTSAFIKPGGEQTKKYEFRLNLVGGEKGQVGLGSMAPNSNSTISSSSANSSKLPNESSLLSNLKGGGGMTTANTNTSSSSADLLSDGLNDSQEPGDVNGVGGLNSTGGNGTSSSQSATRGQKLRKLYCMIVCAVLWLHVGRLIVGLLVDKSLVTLDFYCLGAYKIHFLIPAMCLAIQAAAVSTLFIRNNDETNWLVPFYSSKDYLIRSRSNFKPKIEDYTKRVNVSIVLALVLALVSSTSLSAYLIHCVGQSDIVSGSSGGSSGSSTSLMSSSSPSSNALSSAQYETLGAGSGSLAGGTTMSTIISLQREQFQAANRSGSSLLAGAQSAAEEAAAEEAASRFERAALASLLTMDVLWAIYSTYICFLVSFYFNLICAIMKSRFHGISKIIEDLAESNTTKTTNQARKITTLYLEHNEACELLDESNDFWQYLIFFTYFTYIPAYCYCLYNLFFVDFEAWPSFITWVIHTHTGFIILLISFSAAGVSTEAHAPYTSLHTLSLIQLPLDVEVNIATFLHRVRGLTIGYSCYDLFAITNASMSNTAAACASYFLIVADFSRSSVFTLAQMNGSASTGATPTTPTPTVG